MLENSLNDRRAQVNATATVTTTDDGRFHLDLRLEGEVGGERVLESTDCQELADAAVLIVALTVDPEAVQPRATEGSAKDLAPPVRANDEAASAIWIPDPDAPPATEAGDTRSAAAQVVEPTPVVSAVERREASMPEPRKRPLWHFAIRVSGGVGWSVLPEAVATGEFNLAAFISGRLWQVELGFAYWIPRVVESSGNSAVGGRLQAWAFEPRGCVVPGRIPIEIPVCVGLELGAIHGRGVGELNADSSMSPWIAASLGSGIVWRPRRNPRWGLWLRGEVLPAITRATFGTPQSGILFRQPAVGGRIDAGFEVRLRSR